MSIFSSLVRSFDDTTSFSTKSYAGCQLQLSLVTPEEFLEKNGQLNTGQRLKKHELSGKEKVEQMIVVKNARKRLGNLTVWQIKDIFDDLGFNIGVMGKSGSSDITAAMGLGGFSIPFWGLIPKFFGVFTSRFQKLMYLKLTPSKRRLHLRIFEMHDGSWVIVAHIDYNWINFNIPKVLLNHLGSGKGDYIGGTKLTLELLLKFKDKLESHRVVQFEDIEKIIKSH
ncbi:MAG: hypothetical protein UX26_C0032G0006 [Parcubacteria group bacterium GW2011_GWC1_45_9]|nr:MAG: hypothetical protein UX26_C0032G0006 [Parcubacteria group bacterium GW2011_GWC1_45_9]